MICEFHFIIKKNGEPNCDCFCKDVTKIENYAKAVLDSTQTWECHHRRETHYLKNGEWVRRDKDLTKQQLIDEGTYYDVSPSELIFLTKAEHRSLHHKDKTVSDETKRNLSRSLKGRKRPDGAGLQPKKVLCIETGEVFESAHEASRQTGVPQQNISKVCLGHRKTAGGYHWKYYEP